LKNIGRTFSCCVGVALMALGVVSSACGQGVSPQQQNAVGHWQVITSDGNPGGKVETYLENGKLYGRVTKERPGRTPQDVCTKCSGDNKGKLILGMVVMRDFHPDGEGWSGGIVLDPESGSEYKGKIWLEGKDTLKMRGFIGISLLGKTASWSRIP